MVFNDLLVRGVGTSSSYQPTLGSILNPLTMLEEIKNARHPPLRDIISGFEGVVKPGEMLRECGYHALNHISLISFSRARKSWGWVQYPSEDPCESQR